MNEEALRKEFNAWHASYMAAHAYQGDLFCAFKAGFILADTTARREDAERIRAIPRRLEPIGGQWREYISLEEAVDSVLSSVPTDSSEQRSDSADAVEPVAAE